MGSVLVAIGAGESRAVADFAAELDEKVGRRDPFHLQPVVLVLAAEERLIDERRVVEIPRVLVHVIEIPDARQEPAELWGDAVRRGGVQPVRFLDLDRILGRKREGEIAVELVVDVRRQRELGFGDAEAALRRRDVAARRKPGDRILIRILRQIRVDPLQHGRDGRVESRDSGGGCG